jgi:hypothetical protein
MTSTAQEQLVRGPCDHTLEPRAAELAIPRSAPHIVIERRESCAERDMLIALMVQWLFVIRDCCLKLGVRS